MSRKKIPQAILTKIFMMSRRRCCICSGLEQDFARKRGQIAHLDGNSSNNDIENLAYLCLAHHDEFDGSTSQSKGFTINEVKTYRKELYQHFSDWSKNVSRNHLLNFLASRITNKDIAQAVVDIASDLYFYGPTHALDVLTTTELRLTDGEIILNHLIVLDNCAAWGLLTYQEENVVDENGYRYTLITVNHLPICQNLAEIIETWIQARGGNNWR